MGIMKKLIRKIRKKEERSDSSERITSDTIAEHREKVLAGGRTFKYPVQYVRHKLVFNAVIIGIALIFFLVALSWWQLYIVQNTSDFMYRVTRVIPIPVAVVDGQSVKYSDYLMKYRSSIHYLQEKEQINFNTEDGQRQSDFVKSQAMTDAIADTYAIKLAQENNITVSDAELEAFLKAQRASADGEVSQATYDAVILDYYGWSPEEYRYSMKTKLLRQKVAYAVDQDSTSTVEIAEELVRSKGTKGLKSVTADINKSASRIVTYGAPGFVPKANQDGGLAVAAAGMKKGEVTGPIKPTNGDGYYFVRLIDINETQVSYEFIHVPLATFSEMLSEVISSDEIVKKYISIPDLTNNQGE